MYYLYYLGPATKNWSQVEGEATSLLNKVLSPWGMEIASATDFGNPHWVNLEHVGQSSKTHFLKFLLSNVWEILSRYNKFILNQIGCLIGDRANRSPRFPRMIQFYSIIFEDLEREVAILLTDYWITNINEVFL